MKTLALSNNLISMILKDCAAQLLPPPQAASAAAGAADGGGDPSSDGQCTTNLTTWDSQICEQERQQANNGTGFTECTKRLVLAKVNLELCELMCSFKRTKATEVMLEVSNAKKQDDPHLPHRKEHASKQYMLCLHTRIHFCYKYTHSSSYDRPMKKTYVYY